MEIIKKTTFDRLFCFQVVLTVQKEKSFSKASKRLGISTSQVTKEVKKIEEYLGVQLFKRTTRSLALTQEGRVALEKMRVLLFNLSELESEIDSKKKNFYGALRITAPTTLGQSLIAGIWAKFQIDHPFMEFDLRFTDRVLDPIEQDIDISIRTAYRLSDSSLFVKRVGELERVIVASTQYLEKFKRPRRPEDLAQNNCLMFIRGDEELVWSFHRGDRREEVKVSGSFKSNNLISLIRACEEGVGILNIPRYLVQEQLKNGELVQVLKSWRIPAHSIYILTSRRPSSSHRLSEAVEYLGHELIEYCH